MTNTTTFSSSQEIREYIKNNQVIGLVYFNPEACSGEENLVIQVGNLIIGNLITTFDYESDVWNKVFGNDNVIESVDYTFVVKDVKQFIDRVSGYLDSEYNDRSDISVDDFECEFTEMKPWLDLSVWNGTELTDPSVFNGKTLFDRMYKVCEKNGYLDVGSMINELTGSVFY